MWQRCRTPMLPLAVTSLVAAQERRDRRIGLERRHLVDRRQLRLVAPGVHHAEKAERFSLGGAELMPGQRRDRDEIVGGELAHLATDEAVTAAAQDQHALGMLVPLGRREAAG